MATMRASRGTFAVAVCVVLATSIVGIVNLAAAATNPRTTATKGVIVTTAASPEVVTAGSTTQVSLTVTVMKNDKPDAKVAVTLNTTDLLYEEGDCAAPFVVAMIEANGKVGVTNSRGQLTIADKYVATNVDPGSFCVIYGGILGGTGISLNGKETGTTKTVGINFAIVICQTNPADDPYTITQSATHTTVTTGGPKDNFTLTVKKVATPIANDSTIFFDEVYSTWNSCGLSNPLPPPGVKTSVAGVATIGYEPSTTVGTCKVTAQEADTGTLSNLVKITQNS
jgi:hypothetical protein